ncbi:MAG: hypothetical protein H6R44_1020 [Nitrospirae bacterium]|nr:hypothetical protein [Nitrospirota bacterium]
MISEENPLRSRKPASRLAEGLLDGVAADALAPEFLLEPAPAESPAPDPACGPLTGELLIVQITELDQVIDDGGDNVGGKFPILQFPLDLDTAAGPDSEIAVGGVLGPFEPLVFRNRAGRSMLRPC